MRTYWPRPTYRRMAVKPSKGWSALLNVLMGAALAVAYVHLVMVIVLTWSAS